MSVIAGPATTEIALTGSPQRCYPGKVRMLEHRKTGPGIGSPVFISSVSEEGMSTRLTQHPSGG
jgi:hypothetical protein